VKSFADRFAHGVNPEELRDIPLRELRIPPEQPSRCNPAAVHRKQCCNNAIVYEQLIQAQPPARVRRSRKSANERHETRIGEHAAFAALPPA